MQSKFNSRRVVITGAPGSGKTTILNYIKARGYHVEPEAARVVIQKQLQHENPVLPWTDRVAFDRLMLPVLREAFERARPRQIIFYDRGLPDLIGWACMKGWILHFTSPWRSNIVMKIQCISRWAIRRLTKQTSNAPIHSIRPS